MASLTYTSTNLHRGPGSLTLGTQKFFSKEAISADVKIETWRPKVSTHGEGAPRITDALAEISFTPSGIITPELLTLLYPAALKNPMPGLRLFPGVDVALLIHGTDMGKVNFPRAAMYNMPSLKLSTKETAIGEATISALIAQGKSRETAGSFYTIPEAAAWSGVFSDNDIITSPYSATYNSIDFLTEEGWEVTFDLSLKPVYVEGIGTVDFEVEGVSCKATCTPVNMSATQLMAALRPEGLMMGSSMRLGKDLVITAAAVGGLVVTLYDAVMAEGPAQWQAGASRAGQVTFEASRKIDGSGASATFGNLFDITRVAAI